MDCEPHVHVIICYFQNQKPSKTFYLTLQTKKGKMTFLTLDSYAHFLVEMFSSVSKGQGITFEDMF